MNTDRLGPLIILVILAAAFTTYILWARHDAPFHEVIATFDGYSNQSRQNTDLISASWPPRQYALITITKIVRSNFPSSISRRLSLSLDEDQLTTDQGRPLVAGHTYSFRLRQTHFNRGEPFRVDIRESPETKPPPPITSSRIFSRSFND